MINNLGTLTDQELQKLLMWAWEDGTEQEIFTIVEAWRKRYHCADPDLYGETMEQL